MRKYGSSKGNSCFFFSLPCSTASSEVESSSFVWVRLKIRNQFVKNLNKEQQKWTKENISSFFKCQAYFFSPPISPIPNSLYSRNFYCFYPSWIVWTGGEWRATMMSTMSEQVADRGKLPKEWKTLKNIHKTGPLPNQPTSSASPRAFRFISSLFVSDAFNWKSRARAGKERRAEHQP